MEHMVEEQQQGDIGGKSVLRGNGVSEISIL